MADAVVENSASLTREQRLRQKRKDRKKAKKKEQQDSGVKKPKINEGDTPGSVKLENGTAAASAKPKVEIEVVAANPLDELERDDPAYQEFASIFARFSSASEDETTTDVEMSDQVEVKPDPAASSALSGDDSDDEGQGDKAPKISNRKKRQLRRLNIAALKQIVKRPDLVEIHDCSSSDPLLVLHMKGYRNSVPVPRHALQRRKYLQVRPVENLFLFPALMQTSSFRSFSYTIPEL